MKGSVVAVTGSEGFIGKELVRRLNELGAEVHTFDLQINENMDITNPEVVYNWITAVKPKYVFHLAANSIVSDSADKPLRTYEINVQGTWNVLDACRLSPFVEGVVATSSNHIYGEHDGAPTDENAQFNHTDTYAITKIASDYICKNYGKVYNVPVVALRHTNGYGPTDPHKSHIIPYLLRCMIDTEKPVIKSNGLIKKGFMYMDDVLDAYILCAEKAQEWKGEGINCSIEESFSPLDLWDIIQNEFEFDLPAIVEGNDVNESDENLDCTRLIEAGWSQRVSLRDGLNQTVQALR